MEENLKQLLLKDLCARLPYHLLGKDTFGKTRELKVVYPTGTIIAQEINGECCSSCGFVPYLRSMSSMTEDEREEYRKLGGVMSYNSEHNTWAMCAFTPEAYDWLNKKMFDYRGLIPMGLALEAPKDMYNTKTE